MSHALELAPKELCQELGEINCVNQVFLSLLGGNDPIEQGMVDRPNRPSLLTPIAVERIVVSGCSKRLALDRKSTPKVFKHLGLAGGSADIEKQISLLFQRLHSRSPSRAA